MTGRVGLSGKTVCCCKWKILSSDVWVTTRHSCPPWILIYFQRHNMPINFTIKVHYEEIFKLRNVSRLVSLFGWPKYLLTHSSVFKSSILNLSTFHSLPYSFAQFYLPLSFITSVNTHHFTLHLRQSIFVHHSSSNFASLFNVFFNVLHWHRRGSWRPKAYRMWTCRTHGLGSTWAFSRRSRVSCQKNILPLITHLTWRRSSWKWSRSSTKWWTERSDIFLITLYSPHPQTRLSPHSPPCPACDFYPPMTHVHHRALVHCTVSKLMSVLVTVILMIKDCGWYSGKG